jgi:hypothetical protein
LFLLYHRSNFDDIVGYDKCIFVRLIDYCFTSPSRFFPHLYEEVTITDEGLQNLDLCSALRAFEQEGSLSCHGASVFPASSEGLPYSVASYDTQGEVEDLL